MLTRYLWGQINSACITLHQLMLTFGRGVGGSKDLKTLWVPAERFFDNPLGESYLKKDKWTANTIHELCSCHGNIHQNASVHGAFCLWNYDISCLTLHWQSRRDRTAGHSLHHVKNIKSFYRLICSCMYKEIKWHRTLLKRKCIRVSVPLPKGGLKSQPSRNGCAKFGHPVSQIVCVVLAFSEMCERETGSLWLQG